MDFDTKLILTYVYLLIAILSAYADDCIRKSECSCSTSDHTIDLTPLSQKSNPRFSVSGGDYTYKYQPCSAVTSGCDTSKGPVAVCQESATDKFTAGLQDSAVFSGDPALNTLQVKYIGPTDISPVRSSTISLICAQKSDGEFSFQREDPKGSGQFFFELRTRYACLNSPSPGQEHHGLSTGSVLLILFFVFLAVYFIGGILFLRFARGAKGTEMVPNFEFWTDLPALIKDGIMFTCRGCKTDSSYSQI